MDTFFMLKFPDGAAVLAAIVMSCRFLMEACFSHWKKRKNISSYLEISSWVAENFNLLTRSLKISPLISQNFEVLNQNFDLRKTKTFFQ